MFLKYMLFNLRLWCTGIPSISSQCFLQMQFNIILPCMARCVCMCTPVKCKWNFCHLGFEESKWWCKIMRHVKSKHFQSFTEELNTQKIQKSWKICKCFLVESLVMHIMWFQFVANIQLQVCLNNLNLISLS